MRAYARDEAVAAVRSQRARTIALLEAIDEASWEQPVLPGWRVREVAGHLIATDEAVLTGRMLRLGVTPVPVEKLEAWNETQVRRWSGRPIPALLHGLDRWGRRLVRVLGSLPAGLGERPIPSPFGSVSPAWLGMMRTYDEWIHGEDVRAALGMPADDDPAAVQPVARHLFEVITVQTLPRIPPAASGVVQLRLTDPDLPAFGIDMPARTFGVAVTDAVATISGGARGIIMVASGRRAWRDAEAAGALRIEGQRDPAQVFLDALIAV